MIEQSESIANLAAAMFIAQGKLDGVVKGATNPHFKKTYANLEAVIDTAKPALQQAGIVFTQAPGRMIDGAVEITTMLIHAASGEWMRSTLHVPCAKVDPQGVGSAITYGLRYSLMATLGLPPVDDDGEAAMQRDKPRQQTEAPKAESRDVYARLSKANSGLTTVAAFDKLWNHSATIAALDSLPRDWRQKMMDEKTDKAAELAERAAMQSPDFPGDTPLRGTVPPSFDHLETRP
jgi:hypothetical protein